MGDGASVQMFAIRRQLCCLRGPWDPEAPVSKKTTKETQNTKREGGERASKRRGCKGERRRTGGRGEMEGGSKGGDEKRQNESEIQVKLGAWRGEAASYRDRAGDNRGLSKRRGKEGRRDRDRVLKEWRGAGAQKLLCRWLRCLATAVVGRPRAMQGAPHEKLNWCCTAVPRRLDDQLAKQVESWSWPRRNAKSTGCTRR